MGTDKLLYTVAALMDAVRAMQRQNDIRAMEKLEEAERLLMQAAKELPKERIAALF
jgi:uncharacterized membrane protein (DUF106 family)